MQAWVMSSGQSGKLPPGENQAYVYDQSSSPQKSHVSHSQPNPVHQAAVPGNSPPRTQPQYQSRMPIVNANANSRAAGAAAARLPATMSRTTSARPSHQISHSRELSNLQRNRGTASEPPQNSQRHGPGQGPGKTPFWEGSTIEGSTMSETASIADATPPPPAAAQSRLPYHDTAFRTRDMTRQPSKRDSDRDRPPFVIGDNGVIDVLGSPLGKRASTPEVRAHPGLRGFGQDSEHDYYVGEPRYHTDNERTPPNTLNHRGARLPLRTTKRDTFAEKLTYPKTSDEVSSPPEQAIQDASNHVDDFVARNDRSRIRGPAARDSHRTTLFENIDTPIASLQDLSPAPEIVPSDSGEEADEADEQLTPKPAPKSIPPVQRQLFVPEKKSNKDRNSLRESSMPRPNPEKRQSSTTIKKRPFDLDYDDSALAAMDYSELKNQEFDFDPAQAESRSAQRPPPGTLPEKLAHFLHKDADAQSTFFTSMSMRDWDDSGDWFLDKFGDIMNRLKDTRKAKRQLVDGFENEIAEREDAVRRKMHGIDQTLVELRKEGEVMMKNKELD